MIARQPESWAHRAANPDWEWGVSEHLEAHQADVLMTLLWSKTKDAAKGKNAPTPIPRPHVGERKASEDVEEVSPEAIDAYLSLPRTAVDPEETDVKI